MNKTYSGKVREVYDLSPDTLLMVATNRTSSFDRYICDVPGKGDIVNKTSAEWFNLTKHIIPNHVLYSSDDYSVVKKCTPFKIEMIVRGFITGNTNTSLWTHYNNGFRTYCGIKFPDGLVKNQKLETPVLTPTTKDFHDKPISLEDIVKEGYMTQDEVDYVSAKALELYNFGASYASDRDLLLVDTKYEFGKDSDGNIILIDELHTCDSSRYWFKDSYQELFNRGDEPIKLDKDQIRSWVRTQCDPYKEDIPEVPQEIIDKVRQSYNSLFTMLFNDVVDNCAFILHGSPSDSEHVNKIQIELNNLNIKHHTVCSSAHRNTQDVINLLNEYKHKKIVWITVAGMSNALSGVIAANTTQPCIACPPFKDKMDMMVNIHSTLQMPRRVPSMVILNPVNVALAVRNMLNF